MHKRGAWCFNTVADSIVLELASSPGRIVGDTRGRWGLGAVPVEEMGEMQTQLAAALHVFALAEPGSPEGRSRVDASPPALLVESDFDSTGVVQLLHKSSGAPSPSASAAEGARTSSVDNAVVLSSRLSGIIQTEWW